VAAIEATLARLKPGLLYTEEDDAVLQSPVGMVDMDGNPIVDDE